MTKNKNKYNWFTRAAIGAAMADSPAVMTAAGWELHPDEDPTLDPNSEESKKLANNLQVLSDIPRTVMTAGVFTGAHLAPQVSSWVRKLGPLYRANRILIKTDPVKFATNATWNGIKLGTETAVGAALSDKLNESLSNAFGSPITWGELAGPAITGHVSPVSTAVGELTNPMGLVGFGIAARGMNKISDAINTLYKVRSLPVDPSKLLTSSAIYNNLKGNVHFDPKNVLGSIQSSVGAVANTSKKVLQDLTKIAPVFKYPELFKHTPSFNPVDRIAAGIQRKTPEQYMWDRLKYSSGKDPYAIIEDAVQGIHSAAYKKFTGLNSPPMFSPSIQYNAGFYGETGGAWPTSTPYGYYAIPEINLYTDFTKDFSPEVYKIIASHETTHGAQWTVPNMPNNPVLGRTYYISPVVKNVSEFSTAVDSWPNINWSSSTKQYAKNVLERTKYPLFDTKGNVSGFSAVSHEAAPYELQADLAGIGNSFNLKGWNKDTAPIYKTLYGIMRPEVKNTSGFEEAAKDVLNGWE